MHSILQYEKYFDKSSQILQNTRVLSLISPRQVVYFESINTDNSGLLFPALIDFNHLKFLHVTMFKSIFKSRRLLHNGRLTRHCIKIYFPHLPSACQYRTAPFAAKAQQLYFDFFWQVLADQLGHLQIYALQPINPLLQQLFFISLSVTSNSSPPVLFSFKFFIGMLISR